VVPAGVGQRPRQHDRHVLQPELPKRNDGSANTLAFVTSPETVVALALAGTLDFNPLTDTLTNASGEQVQLRVPVGEELPARGFDPGESGFVSPPADGRSVEVKVSPTSDRLQLLEPFAAWDGDDYVELPILLKARASAPPTTSPWPDHGSSTGGTWRTSRGTSSWERSTPTPAWR